MHRLATSFVLGYHGCDRAVGERLLAGEAFHPSDNEYDWLGPGVYFWEANPGRALDFARESLVRKRSEIKDPFVVGAVIELGICLDLTTAAGTELVRTAYTSLLNIAAASARKLPRNGPDYRRKNLDCAVLRRLHEILEDGGGAPVDTVKGIFTEGNPIYPGSGFFEKTHVQIAVRNLGSIKGVYRVPSDALAAR